MAKLTKAEKQSRWVATPIAKVERPLRYIKNRMTSIEKDENGKEITVLDPCFKQTYYDARKGNGNVIARLARGMAMEIV